MDYSWMNMIGNYEKRLIANTKEDDWEVDTVLVTDRSWQYETAVRSEHFRDGSWVIVDYADTEEEARKVHDKWIGNMRNRPTTLYDVYDEETIPFR